MDEGNPNFVWTTFHPFEANNLTWKENYWFYASREQNQGVINTKTNAQTTQIIQEDQLYALEKGEIFGPQKGGSQGQFTLQNRLEGFPSMTIGLLQGVSVNGSEEIKAISANDVLYQSTISESPLNTIYIWVQSDLKSKLVENNVTSPKTKIAFGGAVTEVTVKYNPAEGNFLIE